MNAKTIYILSVITLFLGCSPVLHAKETLKEKKLKSHQPSTIKATAKLAVGTTLAGFGAFIFDVIFRDPKTSPVGIVGGGTMIVAGIASYLWGTKDFCEILKKKPQPNQTSKNFKKIVTPASKLLIAAIGGILSAIALKYGDYLVCSNRDTYFSFGITGLLGLLGSSLLGASGGKDLYNLVKKRPKIIVRHKTT